MTGQLVLSLMIVVFASTASIRIVSSLAVMTVPAPPVAVPALAMPPGWMTAHDGSPPEQAKWN